MNVCRSQFRRLIELDAQIRSSAYPNCMSFAEEWEVSRKTIQRDIEFLKEHGAPIKYDPAKKGYYYLDRLWMMPMLDLSESEFLQLLMGISMARQFSSTPIAEGMESLFDKLSATLGEKIAVNPVFFHEQFSFHGEPTRPISRDIWLNLVRALRADRVIEMTYHSPSNKNPTTRKVEPLHLASVAQEWYLVGWDRSVDEVRHFAVSRIGHVEILAEEFDSVSFDPDHYFANRFGRFIGKPGNAHQVRIRFTSEVASWILEKSWHPLQTIHKHRDGGVTLLFPAPSLYEVKRWVLQWGADAEVLEPKELRKAVTESLSSALSVYQ